MDGLQNTSKPTLWFFTLYLLSCGFQNIFCLPVIGDKVQLPEFIFLVGIIFFASKWGLRNLINNLIKRAGSVVVVLPVLWLLVHLLSFTLAPYISGLLECLGIAYLIFVFLFFRFAFSKLQAEDFKSFVIQVFTLLGWVMSCFSLCSYLFSVWVRPNKTAQVFFDYPYFGDVFRLQGLTTTPAMYISIICLPIGFSLFNYLFGTHKRWDLAGAALFSIVAILTLSKSILFIGFIWIAMFAFRYKVNRGFIGSVGFVILLIHFISTHFLMISGDLSRTENFRNSPYTSNLCFFETNNIAICGSGYFQFKKSAFQIFKDHVWFGVGPGNYNAAIKNLKEKGLYPKNLPEYDPHSTPLGTLATTGLFGFLAWLSLVILVIRKLKILHPFNDSYSYLLGLLIMIVFAESISMDVMNFRHYWLLAVLLSVHRNA